jgi:hypothetical protein
MALERDMDDPVNSDLEFEEAVTTLLGTDDEADDATTNDENE